MVDLKTNLRERERDRETPRAGTLRCRSTRPQVSWGSENGRHVSLESAAPALRATRPSLTFISRSGYGFWLSSRRGRSSGCGCDPCRFSVCAQGAGGGAACKTLCSGVFRASFSSGWGPDLEGDHAPSSFGPKWREAGSSEAAPRQGGSKTWRRIRCARPGGCGVHGQGARGAFR